MSESDELYTHSLGSSIDTATPLKKAAFVPFFPYGKGSQMRIPMTLRSQ